MSEIKIKTANPDVITNIPETLGNLKIKDESGVIRDVKKLYAKTPSGVELVWDSTAIPADTQANTQVTEICGECPRNSEVFYPEIAGLGKRWDYCTWKDTGKFNSSWSDSLDNTLYYRTRSQDINKLNFLAPPPNYILHEYVTFSVEDRFVLFINRPVIQIDNKYFYGPADGSFPCIDICNVTALSCLSNPTSILTSCPTSWDIDTFQQSSNFPYHVILDSECISTSIDPCDTYCYGIPDFSIGKPYKCKSLGLSTIYPVYVDGTEENFCTGELRPRFAGPIIEGSSEPYYKLAYDEAENHFLTIKDFVLIVKDDCDNLENSDWKIRIFLPFYIRIPQLKNEYIEIKTSLDSVIENLLTTNPSPQNLQLIDKNSSNYTIVVDEVYRLLSGQIKGSSLVYFKNTENENIVDYWGAVGFPKYSLNPDPLYTDTELYHTHMVVIEVDKAETIYATFECSFCANTANTGNYRASNIRFYPLKNKNVSQIEFPQPLKGYMDSQILSTELNFKGLQNVIQITEMADDSCFVGLNGTFYKDIYVAGVLQSTSHPDNLTFNSLYNAYYQPYITTIESQDCNTTCL
jgi:hypothetical protein